MTGWLHSIYFRGTLNTYGELDEEMTAMKEDIFDEPFVLVDEDGKEVSFQYYDTIEYDGKIYIALIPEEGEDDGEDEMVILRMEKDEKGNDVLATIEDDEEYDAVCDALEEADWDDDEDDEDDEDDDTGEEDGCCCEDCEECDDCEDAEDCEDGEDCKNSRDEES